MPRSSREQPQKRSKKATNVDAGVFILLNIDVFSPTFAKVFSIKKRIVNKL